MIADPRIARWTEPLASPRVDGRLHPSFDIVRAETAKLESPSAEPPDWAVVMRAADAYLAEVGRDLVIGAALASALAHREGVAGVTLGAATLARLLADPELTPPRPRARANALAWFATRAEIALDTTKERSRPALEALDAALDALTRAATASLGGEAPTTRGARERVRRVIDSLPQPAPIAAPSEPAPVFAPPPPMSSVAVAAPSDAVPDRADQVPAFVRRTSALLVQSAALVRVGAMLDADALRLTLVALYLPITSAPETTRDARTALPAPPKLVLESLRKQQTSAPPETVVRDALAALERSRFALDLHAALAHALERAGATHACGVHRHEVVGLLTRVPELLDREFADGTPFASPETRALFERWRAPASPHREETADLAPSPPDEMRALLRQGRVVEALELGARARGSAASGRARFDTTLALAAVAEQARAASLAEDLHAALVEDMDRHALDAWEPALTAAALRAHVGLLRAAPGTEAKSRPLFARLARIDARAAFELSTAPHATLPKTVR